MESVFEWEEPWFPDWRDKVTMLNVSDPGEVGGWRLDVTIWSGESPQPQKQFSNLVSLRSVSSSLVQLVSSQFNKFKQTALLSDSPAVPSASVVRCDEAALAVIAVQHKMLVVKG